LKIEVPIFIISFELASWHSSRCQLRQQVGPDQYRQCKNCRTKKDIDLKMKRRNEEKSVIK